MTSGTFPKFLEISQFQNIYFAFTSQADPELTVTDTQNGVAVTATTMTQPAVHKPSHLELPTPLSIDEFSAHTVSLGIGNITVMTPTGTVTSFFDDEADTVPLSLSDDEFEKMNNVTFGYNEDESDCAFSGSGSGSDVDVDGNIEVIEENTELEPLSDIARDRNGTNSSIFRRVSNASSPARNDPQDGYG